MNLRYVQKQINFVIEVNPRMWGSIPLAIDSGVEFPYLLYLCSTEGPEAAIEYHQRSHLKLNWKAKWLLGEFFIVFQEILSLNLRNIFKILSKRADSLDDFHKDDPSAFFGQVIAYLHKGIKGMSLNPSEKGMLNENVSLFDFDGTITSKDTIKILIQELLRNRPLKIFHAFSLLVKIFLESDDHITQENKNKLIGEMIKGLSYEELEKPLNNFKQRVSEIIILLL